MIVTLHHPAPLEWSTNPDVAHPAASLLKVPIVAGLLIAGSRHEIPLDQRVRPDQLGTTRYPTVRAGFSTSTITLRELAALAIVTSDNAAATHIFRILGTERYEQFLRSAGCDHTGTPDGFNDDQLGALARVLTTARDQTRILNSAWTRDCLAPLRVWMANNLRNARLSARTEPPDVFAHKTGTLAAAAHDAGILTTPTFRASVVALTSDEPDTVATSAEMADLGTELTVGLAEVALRHTHRPL